METIKRDIFLLKLSREHTSSFWRTEIRKKVSTPATELHGLCYHFGLADYHLVLWSVFVSLVFTSFAPLLDWPAANFRFARSLTENASSTDQPNRFDRLLVKELNRAVVNYLKIRRRNQETTGRFNDGKIISESETKTDAKFNVTEKNEPDLGWRFNFDTKSGFRYENR